MQLKPKETSYIMGQTTLVEQIQNYSPVELSKWLKEQPAIQSDYDIFKMLFDK